MKTKTLLSVFLFAFTFCLPCVFGEDTVPEWERQSSRARENELSFVEAWGNFLTAGGTPGTRYEAEIPFSFQCGERSSRQWVTPERAKVTLSEETGAYRKYTLVWNDEISRLTCEMDLTVYRDLPALEWVVSLTGTGDADTEPIHDFAAFDLNWKNGDGSTPNLYYASGSKNLPEDFRLIRRRMAEEWNNKWKQKFDSGDDMRTSAEWLPFFNYQTGSDGLILALGWNGGWLASFNHNGEETHITAQMKRLQLRLHPGEKIRSLRAALLYYEEPFIHGQNMFRQFMLAHHAPHRDGKPVLAPVSLSGWGRPQAEHFHHIEQVKKYNIPFDTYWIDAAWYGDDDDTWYEKLGDWEVGQIRYPSGSLRPVSDAAADAGMKFLLWVEPLRAMGCTKAVKEHADIFLRSTSGDITDNERLLLDLTKEKGLEYGLNLIGGIIEKFNVKWYREDFNMNPGPNWAKRDSEEGEDRTGITEIRYTEGFYRFWDTLLEKYPDLAIDQCASGGRRIELEALSRSVPLWRDDYNCNGDYIKPEEIQNQSFNLSYWIAGHGTGVGRLDWYWFRNVFCPGMSFPFGCADQPDLLKPMVEELQRAKEFFYGDFYPLLEGNLDPTGWAAYHYYLPEKKAGMLMAIRRPESAVRSMTFEMNPLNPNLDWEFEDADTGKIISISGEDLKEKGMRVTIPKPRRARLYFYRAVEK